ncbi:testis-specific serine/threonine-protein kinase 6-like [Salminus brasiliensis]|uniref:testis-specific serine/threonine-protein kinase 6-like n=1 Tax=Salminus brasiliensis TaxID=930266 RepID=UPI003B835ABB
METNEVLRSLGFEVLDNIGKGNFGEVKLVTSERHPDQVAIKIIDRKLMAPYIASKHLPRELTILKVVKHRHIVHVHDIFDMPNGQVYIVMEPAKMDLSQKIQELNRIPISQAKKWFSQLLSAVVYLHQKDIVHRDLKCNNVLLTADDQVKLTDFGFGRFSRGYTDLSETYCGTLQYTAPEVHEEYDPKKSDVWSLGVILFVMVTGSMPFNESNKCNLRRLQREPLVYPDAVTVEGPCRAFISFILKFNPIIRPSATEVAMHPWLSETSESAGSSVTRRENMFGTPLKHSKENCEEVQHHHQHTAEVDGGWEDQALSSPATLSGLYSFQTNTDEHNTIKHAEKFRVIGRFVVVAVDDEDDDQDRGGIAHQDVSPLQKGDCSRAGASLTCRSIEAVEEEDGCFSCSPLCAAVKKAASACVVAPILRASRSLRRRMKLFFKRSSLVHDSSSLQGACHSTASTEAPACSHTEHRREDGTPDVLLREAVVEAPPVLLQPTVKQEARRLRFPQFKILKMMKRIRPL